MINADGAGVGWYKNDDDNNDEQPNQPCIFRTITPAWSNVNLHRLSETVRSPLVFAHVRESTNFSNTATHDGTK